ncbi:hypothetical protein FE251_12970 [Georgenia wutianyii]|uniref:DUF4366 domain-containing protein n=1 Tax=Georgenia wutianyii TaxID=2585135 RepID=A0ABX5VPN1_9MICO|nr:hypothetical protein [Georgenia wutianyii]QDB80190.1 hypothetical protein FE251_12970 [Georgenia wutianyii]
MTHRLLRAVLTALLVAVPTAALAATEDPGAPAVVVTTAPEDVVAWFAEQGPRALTAAELDAPDQLTVGTPRPVARWTEAFLTGQDADQVAEQTAEWVAPVLRQVEDVAEAVAVVHAAEDGGLELVAVVADTLLAETVAGAPEDAVLVADDTVEGWFGLLDGEVRAVSEGARGVLQGSLPPEVFQTFLAGWHGESGTAPPRAAEQEDAAALSPLVPVAIIVVGAVVAWLLVRHYRRADSRIAADVRAGLEPPPPGEDTATEDPAQR